MDVYLDAAEQDQVTWQVDNTIGIHKLLYSTSLAMGGIRLTPFSHKIRPTKTEAPFLAAASSDKHDPVTQSSRNMVSKVIDMPLDGDFSATLSLASACIEIAHCGGIRYRETPGQVRKRDDRKWAEPDRGRRLLEASVRQSGHQIRCKADNSDVGIVANVES